MFNDVKRLVGGAGTSALTFLYTAMLGANLKEHEVVEYRQI